MVRGLRMAAIALLGMGSAVALALDPPHDLSKNIICITCHTVHHSPGGTLNRVSGNANVCLTCHVPSGQAAARPLAASDEAVPPLPNPTGWTPGRGTSHRWDSGPSGYVLPVSGNNSTGKIASDGAFTGRIEELYTITIATAGAAGAATFNWTSLRDGSGTAVLSGTSVAVGTKGLTLSFADGAGTPSFRAGDQWTLQARTDLRLPSTVDAFERPLGQRVMAEELPDRSTIGGLKVVCSTCHDQHSQKHPPFDPNAPAFLGAGTGWTATGIGRHLQRQPNDGNQMCKVCHSPRNVTSSAQGSHPVGVAIPGGDFRSPPAVPLSVEMRVECMSCHAPHYQNSGGANAGAGDGFLLRQGINDLCFECHANADRAGGSHFSASTGALWGGSKDLAGGTEFPPHTADKRGACVNCHWPHGWPDRAAPAQDYPKLWVERYDVDRTGKTDGADGERLCYACHTSQTATALGTRPASPATSNLEAEFARGSALSSPTGDVYRHPVNDNEQQNGPAGLRVVECANCHNPHKATAPDRHAGVAGTALDNTAVAAGTRALRQFELCFNCHGATFNSVRTGPSAAQPWTTDKRLDFQTTNSAYHPVAQPGRNKSANLANQLSGASLTTNATIRCTDCHNSSAYSGTTGPVVESGATGPVGPHGSANPVILRATFNRTYTGTGWNNANGNLCFRCHDSAQLFGAGTGFTDRGSVGGYQRGNLHTYHLTDKGATSSCLSCHYDIHSNRSASNTVYRWMNNGTLVGNFTSPPPGLKTKLVNFAPDVAGNTRGGSGTSQPLWEIDVVTRVRKCSIECHGKNMDYDRAWYQPTAASDDPSHTYRTTNTAVVSSANPSTTGQTVTFAATITGTSVTPTGSVAFVDGPVTLCAASPISASAPFTATCVVPAGTFRAGGHGVVAIYTGDADDGASSSPVLLQVVN